MRAGGSDLHIMYSFHALRPGSIRKWDVIFNFALDLEFLKKWAAGSDIMKNSVFI
jgi:hypothetical protein